MMIRAEDRIYRIGEVMELSDSAYQNYRRELQSHLRQKGACSGQRTAIPSCLPWVKTVRTA